MLPTPHLVDQSREVAGLSFRLHYEVAALVARYGSVPDDIAANLAMVYAESSYIFARYPRSRGANPSSAEATDLARAYEEMRAAADTIRPRLTYTPTATREQW